MSAALEHPDFVGRYTAYAKQHFFALRRTEFERSGFASSRILVSIEIAPGRFIACFDWQT